MDKFGGLILSTVLLVVFLVGALLLVRLNVAKQSRQLTEKSAEIRYPFSEAAGIAQGLLKPTVADQSLMDAVIRQAHADWFHNYILTEKDPRRAFLRTGTVKRLLKYEYSSTSLGQGLALMISALMAGEDPMAQSLFDRLLYSTVVRPSLDHEDLSSWQMTPDGRHTKVNADLHAEAWIGFATLAAMAQWKDSVRVDYKIVSDAHLNALAEVLNREGGAAAETAYSPYFFEIFRQVRSDLNWEAFMAKQDSETKRILAAEDAVLLGDGSNEDATLALQVLNLGLHRLLTGEDQVAGTHRDLERICRKGLKLLGGRLTEGVADEDYPAGFSDLALLSCCASVSLGLGDQELVNAYWASLERAEPAKNDPIGASLRLLALMAMGGKLWFGHVDWRVLAGEMALGAKS